VHRQHAGGACGGDVAKLCACSTASASNALANLVSAGKVRREGEKKLARYYPLAAASSEAAE
jgi:hypothetical protein